MNDKQRRSFLKKSTAAAGLLLSNPFGQSFGKSSMSFEMDLFDYSRDGGMEFSLPYFFRLIAIPELLLLSTVVT